MSWLSWRSPATVREQPVNSDAPLDERSGTSETLSEHSPGRVPPDISSDSSSGESSRSSSPASSRPDSRSPSPPNYSVALPFTSSSVFSSFMTGSKPDVAPPSTRRTQLTHRSDSWSLLLHNFTSRLSNYITVPRSTPGAEDIGNILLFMAYLLTILVALACINDVAKYYLM